MTMRFHSSKGAILVSGLLAAITPAQGIVAANAASSYRSIPERNAFSLKPGPRPEPLRPAEPVLQKIILTGITTILGNKRALMKVIPPARQGEQPKEVSLILTEGQREADVEVLQIDEKAEAVKVINSGREATLTFEKDGAKLPSTPGTAGIPGTANIPTPAAVPGSGTNPVGVAAQPYRVPTRTFSLPPYHPAASNVTTAAAVPPLSSSPASTSNAAPSLTPEQQAALALIEREATQTTTTQPTAAAPANSAVPPPGPIMPGGSTPITEPGQANLSGRIPPAIVPQ
jgi:hypothetical protein